MAGREGGREAFRNFDQEKKEDVRQAGRSAWAEASNYQQEGILHLIRNFDSITMFQVTHFIVNHFKTFKDPETGAYTNNCQGIHGVIKQDGRAQFGRLPYLNAAGQMYYLDLLVWRAITSLQKVDLFVAFLKDLWM